MSYSMSLNSFKKVAAVATFLATVACLVPESAQAIPRPRGSGDSASAPGIDISSFEINLSVPNSGNDTEGKFIGAIQNFEINVLEVCEAGRNYEAGNPCEGVEVGTETNKVLPFPSGDLKVSQILENDLLKDLISTDCALFNNNEPCDPNASSFSEGGVKYEAIFGTGNVIFTFFVPLLNQDPSTLISSLSTLPATLSRLQRDDFNRIVLQGKVSIASSPINNESFTQLFGLGDCSQSPDPSAPIQTDCSTLIKVELVPEPASTVSLLGVGALGAVSLLKRNRRSSNLPKNV